MKVKTIEMAGFGSALKALRLPHSLPARSNVYSSAFAHTDDGKPHLFCNTIVEINQDDLNLMTRLVRSGDEHAKVLRGIVVYAEITAPIYWWCEMETYTIGHQRLSSASTMHVDCKGLVGEELQKAKAEIPMGKELTKIDFFSYQCLRHIWYQRKNHRLQEWKDFCKWIESLPYAEELIIASNED